MKRLSDGFVPQMSDRAFLRRKGFRIFLSTSLEKNSNSDGTGELGGD